MAKDFAIPMARKCLRGLSGLAGTLVDPWLQSLSLTGLRTPTCSLDENCLTADGVQLCLRSEETTKGVSWCEHDLGSTWAS